jgi:hypothetical protein
MIDKLIVPFKMEPANKNQAMSIESDCNKEKIPDDKVINPKSTLIIIGLLNLINKSRNTINENTKIEKYNLDTNSIKSCGVWIWGEYIIFYRLKSIK